MKEAEMDEIARLIDLTLGASFEQEKEGIVSSVKTLTGRFPLY